jgi:hypothetical protein
MDYEPSQHDNETHLVVHGIQPMSRNNIPGMNQPVQSASTLRQMRVVRIVRPDPIQNEIEAVGEVGDAGAKAVEVEAVFDVGSFDFAEHFVAFEAAEPVNRLMDGWMGDVNLVDSSCLIVGNFITELVKDVSIELTQQQHKSEL